MLLQPRLLLLGRGGRGHGGQPGRVPAGRGRRRHPVGVHGRRRRGHARQPREGREGRRRELQRQPVLVHRVCFTGGGPS